MTGTPDLTGRTPDALTVKGLFYHCPPRAVMKLRALPCVESLPLYKAYGPDWLTTIEVRSHLWREPHDQVLDAPITELGPLAQQVFSKRW